MISTVLELPEIELLRRFVSSAAGGHRVESIRVADRYVLNGLSPRTLHARVAGTRLQTAWRRGSVIGIPTDGDWTLLLHLSPGAEVVMGAGPGGRDDSLELELDRSLVLRFRGGRLKGSIGIARRDAALTFGDQLGPDALGISAPTFDEISKHKKGQLKNGLVDQSFVSGLGDVMADEVLYRARLHPHRGWASLSAEERRNLWMALWKTLRDALLAGGDYRRKPQWIAFDRRAGRPCSRCGSAFVSLPGRHPTIACPRCQPLRPPPAPKPKPPRGAPPKPKAKAAAPPKPPRGAPREPKAKAVAPPRDRIRQPRGRSDGARRSTKTGRTPLRGPAVAEPESSSDSHARLPHEPGPKPVVFEPPRAGPDLLPVPPTTEPAAQEQERPSLLLADDEATRSSEDTMEIPVIVAEQVPAEPVPRVKHRRRYPLRT